ncbi:hypothetical protein [Mucilaginibacter frigoritolerans]|nr:hypothetical protein [Mucilaginibacter frigoritolerans]
MKRKILSLSILLCSVLLAVAQTTKIVADGKTVITISQTVSANGKTVLAKVPETLTVVFPTDFYNYTAKFTNGDTTKDLVLTFDPSAKASKNLQIISTQASSVDLTFLSGKLWAIGAKKLDTPLTVPVGAKGQDTMVIAAKTKAATKPAVKTICDLLDDATKKIQETLAISPSGLTSVFSSCFVGEDDNIKQDKLPFRYKKRLLADDKYNGFATSASYLLVYDLRLKPAFSPYVILKIKKDKVNKWEYFEPLKGPFRPASGRSLVIQVIGEKDSTYVFKTDSSVRFMDAEPAFVSQMTASTATPAVTTATSKDSAKSAGGETPHKTGPTPYETLMANVISLESGLNDFNRVFNDINFRENDYYTALSCIQNQMRLTFGAAPANGTDLAALILAIVVKDQTPNKYYQDFCNHASSVKQLYDLALNKKVTYSSTITELTVPDVDAFNVHIRTKNVKTDLTNKQFNVQSGLKIDFSTGVIYSSLGNQTFVTGSQIFQYKDAVQTVNPTTGAITTTYNPNLLSVTRTVIYKNESRAFGAGVLAHVYIRTGGYFDFGVASGVFLNSSQIQGLLGPSIMLGNATKRFCISGGIAAGQVSQLSAENQQYYYNGKSQVYDNINDVPQAYTSTSTPATVNHMKYDGWFIALTYNLSTTITK